MNPSVQDRGRGNSEGKKSRVAMNFVEGTVQDKVKSRVARGWRRWEDSMTRGVWGLSRLAARGEKLVPRMRKEAFLSVLTLKWQTLASQLTINCQDEWNHPSYRALAARPYGHSRSFGVTLNGFPCPYCFLVSPDNTQPLSGLWARRGLLGLVGPGWGPDSSPPVSLCLNTSPPEHRDTHSETKVNKRVEPSLGFETDYLLHRDPFGLQVSSFSLPP